MMRSRAAVVALAAFAPVSMASAQDIDPRGVYFHTFSGSFGGTEYSTIFPVDGELKYNFNDINNGLPFDTTISPAGEWTFDNNGGVGAFSSPDEAAFDILVFGFQFQSSISRVPFTTPEFPVLFESAEQGDADLEGFWNARVQTIDPASGQVLCELQETAEVLIDGTTLRWNREDGSFFQGPFETEAQVAIRAVRFNINDPRFQSFPGSITSSSQNVLGELLVRSDERIEGVMLLQTNVPVGGQAQTLWRVILTRECPADVNGDNNVDGLDFGAWLNAFNAGDPAADQNGDGAVNGTDFGAWLNNFNAGCGL